MSSRFFIGLISGTSRDGVDVALVDFENDRPALLHATCTPYRAELKNELNALLETRSRPLPDALRTLDSQLGHFFTRVCRNLMGEAGIESRDITAIGSHGQTVWHEPGGENPVSIQLGNGAVMANKICVPTVTNFRSADLQAGGQGAPLAPLLHREVFHSSDEYRAVLNLGGIANLTLLPLAGQVSGFDCGPANCLLDAWVQSHLDRPFDRDGKWAASGTLNTDLLDALLREPYFSAQPPKSTGLELFNPGWLENRLGGFDSALEDVQCTLVELTARTVAQALEPAGLPERLLVCGGGIHNAFLMSRLKKNLPDVRIESTFLHGLGPDWVEAVLFAWLARERLAGRKLDTGSITGASEPVLLGDIHKP